MFKMKMFYWDLCLLLVLMLVLSGCPAVHPTHPGTTDQLANSTYDLVAGAKGFLDKAKEQHPECATGTTSDMCARIGQAVGAKDLLIDALTLYCSGPNFLSGGACDPPAKGTPARTQVEARLRAAVANSNQISGDLKKAAGGN